MHIKLFDVRVLRGSVGFGGETDEPVVVEEDAQRVAGSDENVNAKIKLESVDEKGFVTVLLDYHVIVLWYLKEIGSMV